MSLAYRQWARQCLSKRKYKSAEVAEKRAKQCHVKFGGDFHAYWCQYCCHYHVGHKPKGSV